MNRSSNIKLYYYDQDGIFQKMANASINDAMTRKKGKTIPLIPASTTSNAEGYSYGVPLTSWSSYDTNGKLKRAEERLSHKTCQFTFTNRLTKEGEWNEVYDLREIPFYEIDSEGYYTNKKVIIGITDELVDLPHEKPPSNLNLPKWESDQWVEGDQMGSLVDQDNNFICQMMKSAWKINEQSEENSTRKFVSVIPESILIKPKWNESLITFEEGESIDNYKSQKIVEVKELQRTLLQKMDGITTKHLEQLELFARKELSETSMSNEEYVEHLKQKQSIRQKGNELEQQILKCTKLSDVAKIKIELE